MEGDSKKFPTEFIDSKIKLISSIFENFKKDKFSLDLISSNQKNGPISLSLTSRIQDFSFEEIVFLREELAELFFLLKVNLNCHKKISFIFSTLFRSLPLQALLFPFLVRMIL
jgi:hypothetical protein